MQPLTWLACFFSQPIGSAIDDTLEHGLHSEPARVRPDVTEPDRLRGSDGRGSDGRGSDGRGSDGRGSDGRGSSEGSAEGSQGSVRVAVAGDFWRIKPRRGMLILPVVHVVRTTITRRPCSDRAAEDEGLQVVLPKWERVLVVLPSDVSGTHP
jgi:hypothetical protein